MTLASLTILLGREIKELEQTVNLCAARLERRNEFAALGTEDILADSMAACLHSFYTGLESLLETIAQEFDELPQGSQWHKKLLLIMSSEAPGIRPAVLSESTCVMLDEFRAFRHLFRNLYVHSLRPERIFILAKSIEPAWRAVKGDLTGFQQFLEGMNGTGRH